MSQKDFSKWLTLAGKTPSKDKEELKKQYKLSISLIREELQEFEEALEKDDQIEMRDATQDIMWVAGNLVHFLYGDVNTQKNWNKFNEDFNKVMESNFSKFCVKEDEAKETVRLYSKGTHPDKEGTIIDTYYNTVYYKGTPYYIILRKEDNKILKSHKYKKVKLT